MVQPPQAGCRGPSDRKGRPSAFGRKSGARRIDRRAIARIGEGRIGTDDAAQCETRRLGDAEGVGKGTLGLLARGPAW
ncbi:hypothetical protein [Albidovulum sp.]